MDSTIFTFDTTHHALWAEEIAREEGIPHEVIPAPPEANARCNIALEVPSPDRDRLAQALGASLVAFGIHTR